jgi:hypothetical protein
MVRPSKSGTRLVFRLSCWVGDVVGWLARWPVGFGSGSVASPGDPPCPPADPWGPVGSLSATPRGGEDLCTVVTPHPDHPSSRAWMARASTRLRHHVSGALSIPFAAMSSRSSMAAAQTDWTSRRSVPLCPGEGTPERPSLTKPCPSARPRSGCPRRDYKPTQDRHARHGRTCPVYMAPTPELPGELGRRGDHHPFR